MSRQELGSAIAAAKRWLRSPVTITGEVLGAAALGVVRAVVPQGVEAEAWGRFASERPVLASFVHAAWLDRVIVSPWAIAVFGLSALSLWIVFLEVTQRAWRRWRIPPTERSFASAPFSADVERPRGSPATLVLEVRGRIGLLGIPLLHAGLVFLILAGLGRALLSADAVAWVMEGEVLEAGTRSVQATETGFLARPFSLPTSVRLEAIDLVVRRDGTVERESGLLSIGEPPRIVPIAINEAVDVGRARLYLTQRHGVAVLVEGGADGSSEKRAILLSAEGDQLAGQDVLRDGTLVRVRLEAAATRTGREAPVEVRVARGPALLATGRVAPGSDISWPGGRLAINGLVPWVEIKMTEDLSALVIWAGVLMVLLGVTLFALVTPVDVLIAPRPAARDIEHVHVAMRPHRFAALHEASFRALVERIRAGAGR